MFAKLSLAAGLVGVIAQASAVCLPANGKIVSNIQPPDGWTLGVGTLHLGRYTMHCGMIGIPTESPPPHFEHTIVCDNKSARDEPHGQLSFDTTFLAQPQPIANCPENSPGGEYALAFQEISVAVPETGRGFFEGAEGRIFLVGTTNCEGAVTMRFHGQICVRP